MLKVSSDTIIGSGATLNFKLFKMKLFRASQRSVVPRVHKNKSMQRLISSLWGPGTAKFQVT